MTDRPALEGTVEPPSGGSAREGEFMGMGGPGTLEDAHASEEHATELLGRDASVDDLNPEWVLQRLMRESTDYGKRSRQTARVAALGMLAKTMGMLDGPEPGEATKTPLQRALDMPPEDRRRLILDRVRKLVDAGAVSADEVAAAVRKP